MQADTDRHMDGYSQHITYSFYMQSVLSLWPNEGRFETPGLIGAPSNCRRHKVGKQTQLSQRVASLAWKR
jgi:hypothetical protein